ncbi:MAG: RND transporter [Planctomycetota bacterium]|nr:MAG: RND transporter [Planctomycetota bacterium]
MLERFRFTHALLALGLGLTAACSVGPDYESPDVSLAEHFAGEKPSEVSNAELATWWQQLNDSELDTLVERALDGNLSLRAAAAGIVEARALFDLAHGDLYPQQQTLNASATRVGQSRDVALGAFAPRITEEFAVGANLSWELDLWGRLRRAVEASEAQLEVTVADFDDVVVLLIAEVGSTYVDLRTFEERLRLATENVELQRETLDLARVRHDEGAVSVLDVHQANSVVGQTEALIPLLAAGRQRARHALAVLLGRLPRELAASLADGAIPTVPEMVATGLPAELLRQRPDVRRAERLLAAQSARIGIAEAEFYPHLSLQGSLGWAADDPSDLFRHRSVAGSIGAGLDWKLFNYGRLEAGVRAEEARYDALLQSYRETVLIAQREVEDALEGFVRARERLDALRRSVNAASEAAATVAAQYRGGAVAYTAVFVAQTTLVQQQDTLAIAEGDVAQAFITIYRALGGGWQLIGAATEQAAPPNTDTDDAS